VRRVCDWPHSSFHRYVREGLLPDDWAEDAGGDEGDFGERLR
jgi:putative transposase